MKRSEQNLGGDYGLVGVGRGAGFKLTEAGGPCAHRWAPPPRACAGTPQVLNMSYLGDT